MKWDKANLTNILNLSVMTCVQQSIMNFGILLLLYGYYRAVNRPAMSVILTVASLGTRVLLAYFLSAIPAIGVRLWDYNVEIWNWLNIGGYICLRSVLFFGVSGLLLSYVIYPLLYYVTEPMGEKKVIALAVLPSTLFILDILVNLIKAVCRMR